MKNAAQSGHFCVMRRLRICSVAVLLFAIAACFRANPLVVPVEADVLYVDATISNSYDLETRKYRGSAHITDRQKISKLVAFLRSVNEGMSVPSGTFPTPTHTIEIKDQRGVNLVVYVGVNWIGGRNNTFGDETKNRLRGVTETQRADILTTLGINDYRF